MLTLTVVLTLTIVLTIVICLVDLAHAPLQMDHVPTLPHGH